MHIRKRRPTPEEVDCRYCTEYFPNVGCEALDCIILPERNENVNIRPEKPTEKFRKEGVGREPFSKGFSPDGCNCRCPGGHAAMASASYRRRFSIGDKPPFAVYIRRRL